MTREKWRIFGPAYFTQYFQKSPPTLPAWWSREGLIERNATLLTPLMEATTPTFEETSRI